MIKDTEYLKRHSIDIDSFGKIIDSFKKLRVMVIGDLIVDEYIECEPLGFSNEDASVVVSPIETKRYVGGAGIVAAHIAGLGARVDFFTVVGQDTPANFAQNYLHESDNINCIFFTHEKRITTLKQRYRTLGKTSLRVTQLSQKSIDSKTSTKLLSAVERYLDMIDLILFSDFNYGCLSQEIVDHICSIADEKHIPMIADSQSSSQYGDISRFKHMLLTTPTEQEARMATRDSISDLDFVAHKLRVLSGAKNIIITKAIKGLSIFPNPDMYGSIDDSLSAFNTNPIDVSGAGDSLLAASSLSIISRADIWQSAYLGSVMAGIQVSRQGNLPISSEELLCALYS